MSKSHLFTSPWLLISIVVLSLVVRLYRITNEPLDWHAWRQADTASVTREYVKNGIDLLRPQFHDVSNIPSGLDNLEGYRMVEFPLVNAAAAFLIKYLGFPFTVTNRMLSVLFSLGTLVSLFYLVRSLSGDRTAYLTAFLFGFLPYSIFYSRVILPEPALVFFATFSLATFHFWLEQKKWSWYVVSFISLTLALLVKPSMGFLFPVYAGLVLYQELPVKKWTTRFVMGKILYYGVTLVPAFLIAATPLLAWRHWIEQFPSGIPAYDWLFNSNGIRFRPAWFRWLFWERLTKLILGYVGIIFFPLNFLKFNKDTIVYASWWFGIVTYLAVIATGNVQHDYYQILIMPMVCISMARGSVLMYDFLQTRFSKNLALSLVSGALLGSLVLGWQQVKGYFNINHTEYVVAGQAVDRLTPADALVIAPAFGDTQFLFQTNRRGWPIGFEIEEKIAQGADYYISTSYDDEARQLESQYTVVDKNDQYILINLAQKKNLESDLPKPN